MPRVKFDKKTKQATDASQDNTHSQQQQSRKVTADCPVSPPPPPSLCMSPEHAEPCLSLSLSLSLSIKACSALTWWRSALRPAPTGSKARPNPPRRLPGAFSSGCRRAAGASTPHHGKGTASLESWLRWGCASKRSPQTAIASSWPWRTSSRWPACVLDTCFMFPLNATVHAMQRASMLLAALLNAQPGQVRAGLIRRSQVHTPARVRAHAC